MSDAIDPPTPPGQPGGGHTVLLEVPGVTDAHEIGSGGFGVVYRAEEADLGRTVAVKILAGNLDEAGRIRFDRERRAMGTLSGHPNIVTVYRGGHTPAGNAYLVMEYLARGSLADRLKATGPIGWVEVLTLGVQLSGALETSHRAGVLHRDIKPGNILLSSLGNAKLCDFGIARLQGAPETRSAVVTASLAHAPPDVINGHRPDARSDVYSLASTLYELITGSPPFVRPTDESLVPILARINLEPVPPCDESVLPDPLFQVIERAMSKDPAERPQTALVFGQMLVDAQQRLGVTPTPIPIETGTGQTMVVRGGPTVPGTHTTAPPAGTGTGPSPGDSGHHPAPHPTPFTTTPPPGTAANFAYSPYSADTAASPPAAVPPLAGPGPVNETVAVGAGTTGPPRWLIPTGALAAIGALAVGAILVLSGGGTDTNTDTGAGTSTADTAAPPTTGLGGASVPVGAATSTGTPDAYESYLFQSDRTGSIRLSVPQEWVDVERGPGQNGLPYLAVAPVLENSFYDAFTGAGVSVELIGATVDPATELDQRRDGAVEASCDIPVSDDFVIPYRGRLEAFSDCGGLGTVFLHVVMVDPALDVAVYVVLQGPEARDVEAFPRIVQSLELQKNY